MKLVTYNTRFGLGKDYSQNLHRIADAVRGADVIALQEVRRNWPPDCADQPRELGELLPDYYWVNSLINDNFQDSRIQGVKGSSEK